MPSDSLDARLEQISEQINRHLAEIPPDEHDIFLLMIRKQAQSLRGIPAGKSFAEQIAEEGFRSSGRG